MAERGTIIEGKYEVLKLIGKGGMSKVYLAMDKNLNKQWAIKEIERKAYDKNNEVVVASAMAEANMMKKLDYPSLPRIVDIIEKENVIYVVMDYIEGETLSSVLSKEGAQPQEVVIEWAKELCRVLDYLHTQNPPIIYRDMKPANIMLQPNGNIKLIDFGIAREYKEQNLADTVSLGTKGYAAPEQFGGKGQTDARTDVYCLGVTLYHLLTGQNPCEPPYEIYPIRYWNPQLSSGLEAIIQKCTQLNPEDRYQSCAELLYALDHYDEMDEGYRRKQKRKLNVFFVTSGAAITSVLSAEGYVGKNGIIYNNSDTGVSIKVEDKDSGIYNVKASINNKELVNVSYPDQKTVTESYEINTKDAVINADTNSYDMVITAIDNAGNEYSKTQRVYKDITTPEILSIDMEAAGNKEADGSVSYTETDYGYYFVEDTKVTVTATDGSKEGDSGVKEIHYYTVDANGTKSSEQIVQADAEGKVTFVVQAGFKGQIYACAYDMLNNHEERYVTPSGLIIETAEQHAREKHIDFNKVAAASKDAKGNELYEKDVTVDVTVTDTFSAIRSVEWTVESPYDKENNQSGNVEISNQGAFSNGNADGWSQTKKDKNLVTELKKSFTVKNNSNEIKMHIKMTDRAGNTSEDEQIFSIDKTKPEIKIAFDNETPDAENTTMFKENRVATITVTEDRLFLCQLFYFLRCPYRW